MNTSPIMLHSFPRAIRHVDGDAFFTSVEQALNPDFRGKPVVTGKELQRPEASISKTKTFSASSDDRDFVYAKLVRNLESACIKLRRHHLRALEIQVSLRTKDYAEAAAGARLSRTFQSAPRGAT